MKTQTRSPRLFPLALGLLVAALGAFSQSSSQLRGTVSDPNGAVIGEATVTLANAETGFKRQVLTSPTGEYQFLQVVPGTYKVSAEKPGFSVLTRTDVKLLVNTPTSLDLRMDLEKTTETVNVAAEASAINTVDASVGNAFSEDQVRQLPLQTRNVVELLSLQPGVTSNGEVLGARRDQNNITLDGVDVNDNQNAGLVSQNASVGATFQGVNGNNNNVNAGFNAVLPIPLDSVQEFRVTVGGEGVEQGRSSGGQVTLITKSGTNQLHGSLYEYNRNTATSANTWFNNESGVPVQQLVRNQFGASVGGPIKKDRVFYFVNWEQRKDSSSVAQVRNVPSESLKQGFLNVQLADGSVQTIAPTELAQIDPLGIGLNTGYQKILSQYPVANDPAFGQDGGLNFSGYRFNAPDHLNNMAWVAKMDFKLDNAGKHTLSLRGTLADNTQDQILAQFPGQTPASTERDNSKGLSARYTAVLSPSLINSFNYGLTRLGQGFSGVTGTGFELTSIDPLQNYDAARARSRVNPLNNFVDDLTWTKGKHTITIGGNLRFNKNDLALYTNSFPLYKYGATELYGLGADIDGNVSDYLSNKLGDPNLALANASAVTNAAAALLGVLNDAFVNYQYSKTGQILPQGTPQQRSFIEHSYAGYIGDAYRISHELTLNFGVRYENFRPPYEANGLQVAPTVPLQQFFADRNGGQALGIPANQLPTFTQSYALNGPVNGKPSWWSPDNTNFAPRFSLAYAPSDRQGLIGKIFGKSGAFRVGGALAYDQFGNDLVTQYDQFGSIGLDDKVNFPVAYSFATAPRFSGVFPALPSPTPGGFPFTPAPIAGISGDFVGISSDLKTPYSIMLNASFSRELPGKLTMEIGYMGRLSRRLLMQGDVLTPLEKYMDTKSGVTWQQNAQIVYNLANSLAQKMGVPYNSAAVANAVADNPNLVPNLPFVNDIWPGYKDAYIPGSASANYFYSVYGVFGGSFLDSLHAADRIAGNYPSYSPTKCLSITGCYTFFAQQGSSMPMWMNAGEADFHGVTVSVRRRFANGFQFDFNYTLSHSIDNGSAAESGAGEQGASIQDIYNLSAFRGSSDFDIRNNLNANFMYVLPFGKGKLLLKNAPKWVDQMVSGWQISSIWRYSSPLPSAVAGDLAYNSNYWLSSLAVVNTPLKTGGVHIDDQGIPSIFSSINAANDFQDQQPESTGTRAAVRLAPIFNVDMALAKVFRLPKEGQRLQFRAEAFNALNHPNFTNPSLNLQSPLTFGEFQGTLPPRSMQFALRYEF